MYCEPSQRDFGLYWFGQRGFGGLLENHNRKEGEKKWIPQYNLSAYWREDIAPIPVGYVEPLIPERKVEKPKFTRLPGYISHHCPKFVYDGRNLITAKYFEDDGEKNVRIWTIDEQTKRKELVQIDVQINEEGNLVSKNLEETEEGQSSWKLSNSALELKCSKWKGLVEGEDEKDAALWIRTKKDLLLKKSANSDFSSCFKTAVKNFDENRLLMGDIVLVDYGGMIWEGNVNDENMKRLKVEEETEIFELVECCDHPKMILLATQANARLFDTRMGTSAFHLFESGTFEARAEFDSLYMNETPYQPQQIKRIHSFPDNANNYLIITDHALHLLDDRFPKNAILKMKYSIPNGAHYTMMSNPIKEERGETTAILMMDQILTGISMLKLFRHKSNTWSAVESFHSIGRPIDFNSTTTRGKYSRIDKILDVPTRGMTIVEQPKGIMILQQLDDGSIWWQKMATQKMDEMEKIEEERRSWKRIDKWLEENQGEFEAMYVKNLDENLRKDPKELCKPMQICEEEIIDQNTLTVESSGGMELEFDRKSKKILKLKSTDKTNNGAALSHIVLDCWKNVERIMKESEKQQEELDF